MKPIVLEELGLFSRLSGKKKVCSDIKIFYRVYSLTPTPPPIFLCIISFLSLPILQCKSVVESNIHHSGVFLIWPCISVNSLQCGELWTPTYGTDKIRVQIVFLNLANRTVKNSRRFAIAVTKKLMFLSVAIQSPELIKALYKCLLIHKEKLFSRHTLSNIWPKWLRFGLGFDVLDNGKTIKLYVL